MSYGTKNLYYLIKKWYNFKFKGIMKKKKIGPHPSVKVGPAHIMIIVSEVTELIEV